MQIEGVPTAEDMCTADVSFPTNNLALRIISTSSLNDDFPARFKVCRVVEAATSAHSWYSPSLPHRTAVQPVCAQILSIKSAKFFLGHCLPDHDAPGKIMK